MIDSLTFRNPASSPILQCKVGQKMTLAHFWLILPCLLSINGTFLTLPMEHKLIHEETDLLQLSQVAFWHLESVILSDSIKAHFMIRWQSLTMLMWPSLWLLWPVQHEIWQYPKAVPGGKFLETSIITRTRTELLYGTQHFYWKLYKQLCQIHHTPSLAIGMS